jgi:hypothetical protein
MRASSIAVVATLSTAALCAAGWSFGSGFWKTARGASQAPPDPIATVTAGHRATLFDIPPLRNPVLAMAVHTNLPDDEIVFGVVHAGRVIAYQRAALADVAAHVVHSDIGLKSVVVTHCPRNSCTRVFLAEPGNSPDMRLGGWRDDQTMDLIVGSQRLSQQSHEIPLAELPHIETTWGQWKRQHPETLIYRLPRPPAGS